MAEFHLTQTLLAYWPAVLSLLALAYLGKQYFNRGLHRYPGPFLANFTDAWRAWDVHKDHHAETLIALHERYGPIIRTGPNSLDLADPLLVPAIYGIHAGFMKTAFYEPFRHYNRGKLTVTLISSRDERIHTALKRPVAQLYSLSSITEYEPLVDAMIDKFIAQLDKGFGGGDTPCDLGQWMHYMAFDLILNLTFGNTLGFLDQGTDASGFIAALEKNMDETAVCSQMPWTRYLVRHNPLLVRLLAADHTQFPGFVRQQLAEHQAKLRDTEKEGTTSKGTEEEHDLRTQGLGNHGADFLTRFLQLRDVTPDKAAAYSLSNVIAGSDTTAITLRAIVYFLLKHPAAYQRLVREVRGEGLSTPVTWKEAQKLPYLAAVINESTRLFPAVGLSLERTVPASGLALHDRNNTVIPAGTTVGMNAWVVHRDEAIFGPLPTDEFHPERWLRANDESEETFEKRKAAMQRADLAFGHLASSRVCIGRHIASLEMYKLIPTMLRKFDLALDGEREWTYINRWFVRQGGLICRLERRAG